MKIHLGKPFTGQQILDAFKQALYQEPRNSEGNNQRWKVSEIRDEIHYFLSERNTVCLGSVGIDARLETAYMSEWHEDWPAEARTIHLLPVNAGLEYDEITIQIGTIPPGNEMIYLGQRLHITGALGSVMERFKAELFAGTRARSAA